MFFRLVIPLLYAFLVFCCLLNEVQDYRRILFAEEIGAIVRQEKPATLSALQTALGKHAREVHRVNNDTDYGASISLSPKCWLHLWVDLVPGTDQVKDISLVYFASEDVSLDNPRENLPGPDWRMLLIFMILPSMLFSGLWLYATRPPRLKGCAKITAGILALLSLFAALPLIGLMLSRAIMVPF